MRGGDKLTCGAYCVDAVQCRGLCQVNDSDGDEYVFGLAIPCRETSKCVSSRNLD